MAGRTNPNVAVQALALKRLFPNSQVRISAGYLLWRYPVRPCQASDIYELELEYRQGATPKVKVATPQLVPNEDGLLPHVWDTGHLCVHQLGDWNPGQLLTRTFVPWSMEWLVYYELWRATGIWYGDGPDRLDSASQRGILHPYIQPRVN